MRKPLIALLVVLAIVAAFFIYYRKDIITQQIANKVEEVKPKPLLKYTIENLSKTQFTPSEISLGKIVKEDPAYTSVIFYFTVDGEKVSGLMNVPKKDGTYPVIEMNRGFIEKDQYQPGAGTQHSAEVFATNGFITLAPDFLGYGESDLGADSSIEDRFQTYTTALTLLASIKNLNDTLTAFPERRADQDRVALWGHSNGGQITLTLLEITGKPYPAVLWAPVSKPFPYSILYYTDDIEDHGKALRKVVADFEEDYDAELYSLTNFEDKIQGPIELHQGMADEAVPLAWSDLLVRDLKDKGKDTAYFTYPGEDHNFTKGDWNTIITRNIAFYNQQLNKIQP